jgi:hypothetical protein
VLRNEPGQVGLAAKLGHLMDVIVAQVNTTHCLALYPLTTRDTLLHMSGGAAILEASASRKESEVLAQGALNVAKGAGRACKGAVLGVLAQANEQGSISTARLVQKTGASKSHINKNKKMVAEGDLGVFARINKQTSARAKLLCRTRLDPVHGACPSGSECEYLHDCQCCKDGSTCAAYECKRWNKENARLSNIRRMKKMQDQLGRPIMVTEVEQVATRTWIHAENPARSGDDKEICWMTKGADDFYHEDYRTVLAQCEIIAEAIRLCGDELRAAAERPKNQWERNVRIYLEALQDNALDALTVHDIRPAEPLDIEKAIAEMDSVGQTLMDGDKEPWVCGEQGVGDETGSETEVVEEGGEYEGAGYGARVLKPRCQQFLYGRVLAGVRMWHRPPHNHCDRCAQHDKACARFKELTTALSSVPNDPEYASHAAIVERAGGAVEAWAEQRALSRKLPDLQKHVAWNAETRPFLKKRELAMKPGEALWQLDYGGLNDSANKKVSVWSATVLAPGREQEHFDCFFDQAGKKDEGVKGKEGAAKKDGQTGIFFLAEMCDKERFDGKICLFRHHYPEVYHIILSGDTGNGYRAYAMLEELSHMFAKYGYTVELSPLAPGHAWNRTDARIAHMNTFLRLLLAVSRVFGAKGIAAAFHEAAAYNRKHKRKYMARSHILFREVAIDRELAAAVAMTIGKQLISADLDGGHMGVRGLLYFDFTVMGSDGALVHMPGYARVREYADPARLGNRSRVYTWRKDLMALMCQQCSDELGGPVQLLAAGCTKKLCFVAEQRRKEMKARADALQQQEGPLHARQRAHDEEPQEVVEADVHGGERRPAQREKHVVRFATMQVVREVRAVHGLEEGLGEAEDKKVLWFYVPSSTKDKNNTKRKGWWLYQQDGAPGRYYIGPLADVQKTTRAEVEDVATFPAFPFDCTHELHQTTGEVLPATVRCVTSRALSEEERSAARGGQDVEEAVHPSVQPQLLPSPKRAPSKRPARKPAVVEGEPRPRRSKKRA